MWSAQFCSEKASSVQFGAWLQLAWQVNDDDDNDDDDAWKFVGRSH